MKYYVKQQLILLLFFFSIFCFLIFKQRTYDLVFKKENLVEAILIDKNCGYKLGRRTSNKNMSYISVKYSDSLYNLNLDYKYCDNLKVNQTLNVYKDKKNNKLYLENNTNYNNIIYYILFLIVITMIPFKLYIK